MTLKELQDMKAKELNNGRLASKFFTLHPCSDTHPFLLWLSCSFCIVRSPQ